MSESNAVTVYGKMRFSPISDTAENWENQNPILKRGEMGVVIGVKTVGDLTTEKWPESERVKLGDGIHPWKDLPWWYGPKGEKGEKGDQGEKGESDVSKSASAIYRTESGGGKSITLNDVSPLAHKCSCRLTSQINLESIVKFDENKIAFKNLTNDDVLYGHIIDGNNGTIALTGSFDEVHKIVFEFEVTPNTTYTFLLNFNGEGSQEISNPFLTSDMGREEELSKKSNIVITAREENVMQLIYEVNPNYVFEHLVLKPYLLLGEATSTQYITDFSTVKVIVGDKSYTPTENGIVTGIDSVSPTMIITTDNEHANIVDFTYCVDTKKYVDNAIGDIETLLGGI